jgi:Bacterial PH domain
MLGAVELRPPTMPGDQSPHNGQPDPAAPRAWRVDRRFAIAKVVGAAVFAAVAVVTFPDPGQVLVAGLAAALLAVLAVRDGLAPVRVAADERGVTVVAGFAGRRRLTWSELERVRVDERTRLGLRSQLLELDAGDNLYFFGAADLGAPVADVAEHLARLKARYGP